MCSTWHFKENRRNYVDIILALFQLIVSLFSTGQMDNVDLKTVNFNSSMKDVTEAKIKHLLIEQKQKLPG